MYTRTNYIWTDLGLYHKKGILNSLRYNFKSLYYFQWDLGILNRYFGAILNSISVQD